MPDQITDIYNIVISFIHGMNMNQLQEAVSGRLTEICGLFIIIILLLVFRRIRKNRKLKRLTADSKKQVPAPADGADFEESFDDRQEIEEEEALDQFTEEDADAFFADMEEDDAAPASVSVAPEAVFEEIEPEPAAAAAAEEEEEEVSQPLPKKKAEPLGFLDRLKSGLSKTRQSLSKRFDSILSGNRKIDDDVLEEIEEVLITSDIGVPTTMELMQRIEKKADKITSADAFKSALKQEMLALVDIQPPAPPTQKPHIIMVVGVNGVGKTTTIGKLAAKYSAQGKKVLLSASDTFRAAAVEQLEIWAGRSNADIVKHRDKSDPAAVAFDSVEAAVARDIDVVIVDTAGRLHTKVNLMEELKKIKRSIGKKIPSAPHDTFLVLDATTGQNAVSQARLFNENIDITGIVLTKLDGTAKGGIVLSICNSLNVPIRYIGIGEGVEDLQEFDPKLFVDALL